MLGWLLYRSPWFPRVLGLLLGVAAAGYLAESFVTFHAPGHGALATSVVVVTAGLAEVSLCFYLLIRGVRQPAPQVAGEAEGEGGG